MVKLVNDSRSSSPPLPGMCRVNTTIVPDEACVPRLPPSEKDITSPPLSFAPVQPPFAANGRRFLHSETETTMASRSAWASASAPKWEWEHRSGWRAYKPFQCERIEQAFQAGRQKYRFKSGKNGTTPMVIFFYEMLQFDPVTHNTRKVRRIGYDSFLARWKREIRNLMHAYSTGKPRRELFRDFQERKDGVIRRDLGEREYSVYDHYGDNPYAVIAKSNWFFALSMLAVFLNAVWLAIDADWNTSPTIVEADWVFQLVEYSFATVFILELATRFMAFKKKEDCLADAWFRFDFLLVTLLVLEVVVPNILHAAGGGAETASLGFLSIFRLLRLTRMTRLLRALPELITLLKGIAAAMRSVLFTLMLLFMVLYVFAIIFRTIVEGGSTLERKYFSGIGHAMMSLMLHGTLLDNVTTLFQNAYKERMGSLFCGILLLFVFLSSFTVLNMLIGILCEVVSHVSGTEKEAAAAAFLRRHLLELMEAYDADDNRSIGKEEMRLLMQNPDVCEALTMFGTDVGALRSVLEHILEEEAEKLESEAQRSRDNMDIEEEDTEQTRITAVTSAHSMDVHTPQKPILSFNKFLDVVMRLRGDNGASVTDILELRSYIKRSILDANNALLAQLGQKPQRRGISRAATGLWKKQSTRSSTFGHDHPMVVSDSIAELQASHEELTNNIEKLKSKLEQEAQKRESSGSIQGPPQSTLVVSVSLDGQAPQLYRHASSLTIGQLAAQYQEQHAGLKVVAKDAFGIELGREVRLCDLAAGGGLDLPRAAAADVQIDLMQVN